MRFHRFDRLRFIVLGFVVLSTLGFGCRTSPFSELLTQPEPSTGSEPVVSSASSEPVAGESRSRESSDLAAPSPRSPEGNGVRRGRSELASSVSPEVVLPVAVVSGEKIGAEEVLELLEFFFPRQYDDAVSAAITKRIVALELSRLRCSPNLEGLEASVDEEIRRQRDQIRGRFGDGVTLEGYIRRTYDTDLNRYRERLLRAEETRVKSSLLARYDQLQQERREVRRILVGSLEEAQEVHEKLRNGADFAALVRKYGVGRNREEEGRLPPLTESELQEPVRSAVFSLSEGDLSPILTFEDGTFGVVRLLRVHPPSQAPLPEAQKQIFADLERRPLEERELIAWNARMVTRYGVEYIRD